MRKRKREIILCLMLLVGLGFSYVRLNHLFLTPEEEFHACEEGLYYPPSEEILLRFEREDGALVFLGRQADGISVIPLEKRNLFFWSMADGGAVDGRIKMEAPLDGYLTYDKNYLGFRQDEEIVEVSLVIGNDGRLNFREYVFPVDEEVILIPGKLFFDGESIEATEDTIVYQEGRDAAGRVIFQKGAADLANALRKGNLRPGVPMASTLIRIAVPKV